MDRLCNGNFVFLTAGLWKILPHESATANITRFADAVGVFCSSGGRSVHADNRGYDLSTERFGRQILSDVKDASRVIICK